LKLLYLLTLSIIDRGRSLKHLMITTVAFEQNYRPTEEA